MFSSLLEIPAVLSSLQKSLKRLEQERSA